MKKKIIMALCGLLLVNISCKYMNRPSDKVDASMSSSTANLDEANLLAHEEADERVADYDPTITEALDKTVMEQAKLHGEDPKTYRMKVRTEADGTVIYRMLGMHVFVNVRGEESYLPD